MKTCCVLFLFLGIFVITDGYLWRGDLGGGGSVSGYGCRMGQMRMPLRAHRPRYSFYNYGTNRYYNPNSPSRQVEFPVPSSTPFSRSGFLYRRPMRPRNFFMGGSRAAYGRSCGCACRNRWG
uniref:Uncharacterized protein n=1 Tax=Panagrellus redivivus TaxID=6233 RepID=A0A7E4VBA6_PANRE